MFVKFTLVNPQTWEESPCYLDSEKITGWNQFEGFRGKQMVNIMQVPGGSFWVAEDFETVTQRMELAGCKFLVADKSAVKAN